MRRLKVGYSITPFRTTLSCGTKEVSDRNTTWRCTCLLIDLNVMHRDYYLKVVVILSLWTLTACAKSLSFAIDDENASKLNRFQRKKGKKCNDINCITFLWHQTFFFWWEKAIQNLCKYVFSWRKKRGCSLKMQTSNLILKPGLIHQGRDFTMLDEFPVFFAYILCYYEF